MESIEKLRRFSEWLDGVFVVERDGKYELYSQPTPPKFKSMGENLRDIADEIEAEIEERYMELPLDADGVPIRCGDFVDGGMGDSGNVQHVELWPDGFVVVYECHPGTFTRYAPDAVRHVKPRTIEDVLAEFFHESRNSYTSEKFDLVDKYSDEIRGLL